LRGSLGGLIVVVLVVLSAFVVEISLARVLGATRYGHYSYVMAYISILALVSRFGLDTSIVKLMPAYSVTGEWSPLRGLIRFALATVLVLGVLFSLGLYTGAGILVADSNRELVSMFRVAAWLIPLYAFGTVMQAAMRAQKRIVSGHLPVGVVAPLALAATAWFLGSQGKAPPTAAELAEVNLLLMGAACISLLVLYRGTRPAVIRQQPPQYRLDEWVRLSIMTFLVNGMVLIVNHADTIMLGWLMDTTEAGRYNAAAKIAALVSAPMIITNLVAVPMIAEMHATGKHENLRYLLRMSVVISAGFSLAAILLFALLGRMLLGMFGGPFVHAYPALLILLAGYAVNVLAGITTPLLIQTGHQNTTALIMTTSAVANILLNYLLIPVFGLNGAALSTTMVMIVWNVSMVWYARRKIGVDPSILGVFAGRREG